MAVAAALVLVGCGGETAEKVDLNSQVAGLTGDTDAKVAALAEIAKAGPGASGLVGQIQPLLKDEDAAVRRTAAYTLGSIGPAAKAAIPDLKALLETQDFDQMRAVGNAIRAIDPTAMPTVKVDNVAPAGVEE